MSANEEEIIVFPIRFEVDPQNVEEVKDAIGEGEESTGAEKEEGGQTPEDIRREEALAQLEDFISKTDQQGLQALSKFAKNPGGMVQNELLGALGKAGIHGALATTIIGVIIGSPQIIMTIAKALAVKGGPLNQDFHRFFVDEAQTGFSREIQYRKSVGLDVVITSDNRGFLLQDPAFVTNNLVDVDPTRSIRTSTKETQYGYFNGM